MLHVEFLTDSICSYCTCSSISTECEAKLKKPQIFLRFSADTRIPRFPKGKDILIHSIHQLESRDRIPVGARFSEPVQTGPGTHPTSYEIGTGSFLGGKATGAWRWPPTPSSAEVERRVELYFHSPSAPSWPVIGRASPYFTLLYIEYKTARWCQLKTGKIWGFQRYKIFACIYSVFTNEWCSFKS